MTSGVGSQSKLREAAASISYTRLYLVTGLIARFELLIESAGVHDQGLSDIYAHQSPGFTSHSHMSDVTMHLNGWSRAIKKCRLLA